jgi:hypothetical protein
MRNRLLGWLTLLMASTTMCATPAQAQANVFGPCVSHVSALSAMSFDDTTHRNWYRRFWNGQCVGLFGCLPARKWTDVVDRLAGEAASAASHEVTVQACGLGQLVGYEWARDNDLRKITTDDLERLSHILEGSSDPLARIARVRTEVQALLAAH